MAKTVEKLLLEKEHLPYGRVNSDSSDYSPIWAEEGEYEGSALEEEQAEENASIPESEHAVDTELQDFHPSKPLDSSQESGKANASLLDLLDSADTEAEKTAGEDEHQDDDTRL